MSELNNIVMYGRNHESPKAIHCQKVKASNIAYGISVGVISKANEDCLGISIAGDEILMAVADGHWGREASELAINKTIDMFRSMPRPAKENETRARFYALFEQINQELFTMAMTHPGALAPETTLTVCQLKSLFGESRYIGVADGLETGIEKLHSGDMILLCTDGLIGSDESVPEFVDKNIRTILATTAPLENKVRNLIKSALDKGEKDNISCILAQID